VSVRAPSLVALLGRLQRAGLSYAQLAAFVAAVEARHNGPVIFRLSDGIIHKVEIVESERSRRAHLQHD